MQEPILLSAYITVKGYECVIRRNSGYRETRSAPGPQSRLMLQSCCPLSSSRGTGVLLRIARSVHCCRPAQSSLVAAEFIRVHCPRPLLIPTPVQSLATATTQGYLVFGLPVRGEHAIYLTKYKWEENVFFLLINLLTVIQWVNKACRCFKNLNNTTQVFFVIITEGHTIRFLLDRRVESNIMKKKKKLCKVTPFHVLIQWNYLFFKHPKASWIFKNKTAQIKGGHLCLTDHFFCYCAFFFLFLAFSKIFHWKINKLGTQ